MSNDIDTMRTRANLLTEAPDEVLVVEICDALDEARAKVAALEADRDALHSMVETLDGGIAEYAAHHGPSCEDHVDGSDCDGEEHDASRCEACAVDRGLPSRERVADLIGYDAQQKRARLNIPVNNATQKAG